MSTSYRTRQYQHVYLAWQGSQRCLILALLLFSAVSWFGLIFIALNPVSKWIQAPQSPLEDLYRVKRTQTVSGHPDIVQISQTAFTGQQLLSGIPVIGSGLGLAWGVWAAFEA